MRHLLRNDMRYFGGDLGRYDRGMRSSDLLYGMRFIVLAAFGNDSFLRVPASFTWLN